MESIYLLGAFLFRTGDFSKPVRPTKAKLY